MRHPQQSDIEALVRGEHSDPHSLLGKHSEDGAFVIRAWRPEAQTVAVMSGQNVVAKLERIHPAGLFEGTVDEEPADPGPGEHRLDDDGAAEQTGEL
jgi:1,4-alpha-glucan branching enzyme